MKIELTEREKKIIRELILREEEKIHLTEKYHKELKEVISKFEHGIGTEYNL